MGRNCAVAGCNNSTKTGHTQHAFPKDDRQRNLWVRFVKLTRVDFTVPTKHSAICSEHFSEECYEVDRLRFNEFFGLSAQNSKRLFPGSVPSNYPKRSSDVLNEGFLSGPKKKLKNSKALQKREKAGVLQELLYNTPTEESKDPKETILPEVSDYIPTVESNNPKETIDQVPVLIHTDTCPSPDPCDNGPESYIPMNVDPCPIDLHNDNSDGFRTAHTEVEMVNISTTQKEADNQTPKVATKKKYRSGQDSSVQANFHPRLRSFGIQCNLLPTPIEPQQDNNTEERHQEHNDSGHMEHGDPVVPDDTNDPTRNTASRKEVHSM
ncbi:THAP domain-containing protein 10-like [Mytilus edulis]|uniref:THAP domain-containing protein 10-like n=1 Tax=Mytilus edulis TaxID=6550 RepID=UPI0039EE30AE